MKKNRKIILDNIDDGRMEFYMNLSEDEINSYAKEEEYDIEANNNQRSDLIKRLKFVSKAKARKKSSSLLIDKASKAAKMILEKYEDKPISKLRQLLQGTGLNVQFRNIEKLDKNTIEELLKDIDFVKLIEKLEADGKL